MFRTIILAGLLAFLSACTGANGGLGNRADPVQIQAWANAEARGSSMTCDYMPNSCDGWRSGGSAGGWGGWWPSQKNLTGLDEAQWVQLYTPTLNQLVTEKVIAAPTYEAYAVAYNKPRNPARAGDTSPAITPVGGGLGF